MKKLSFISILSLAMLAACGGNGATTNADSDSVAEVAVNTDSINAANDSLAKAELIAELEKSYDEPISLKVANASHKFSGESSLGTATTTVTLTNNTKVDIDAADYEVYFEYPSEISKYGEIYDCTLNSTAPGQAIPAGESVDITLRATDANGKINKSTVRVKISKEDFLKKADSKK